MPRLSVIIPAYNAEEFLEKCLLSLERQTFKDFEVIVVDDCSKDRTREIAARYATLVSNGMNLGEGASRNAGARASQGEILVFTDADVVAPPDWLQKIVDAMAQLDVKCVGGGYCGSLGDSFMQSFAYHELEYRRAGAEDFVSTLVANNFACDRSLFVECGGFPADGHKCEDLRLSFKISRNNKIYWHKDNGVYHHFRRDLKGYLRQQYFFGRDTVVSYYQFPLLFSVRTHQGRGIYLETVLAALLVPSAVVTPIVPPAALVTIAALLGITVINLRFLGFLHARRLNVVKSLAVLLLRDLAATAGVVAGCLSCIGDLALRSRVLPSRLSRRS